MDQVIPGLDASTPTGKVDFSLLNREVVEPIQFYINIITKLSSLHRLLNVMYEIIKPLNTNEWKVEKLVSIWQVLSLYGISNSLSLFNYC